MYIPSHFDQPDPARQREIMARYAFATVVTYDGAAPFATHMPVLHRATGGPHGTLLTHMARANPQWRHFADGREALFIFQGPHAYVSPSWYLTHPAVPTWNYAAVHVYGVPQIVSEPEKVRAMLRELVAAFESGREMPFGAQLTDEYIDQMALGIVALEIPVSRIEGKFKLNQNRSVEDREGVIAALSASADQTERELAALMADSLAGSK